MGVAHFDEAPSYEFDLGHLRGRWSLLGDAAGSQTVGVRRIQVPAGGWSTPAHEHGRSEEIFYVMAGAGVSWQRGQAAPVRAGDCILYAPRRGPHTLHATEPLDVLAFGTREYDESLRFPQLELSLVGGRGVHSVGGSADGTPLQFAREAEHGPPELPAELGPRPSTIAGVDEVEPSRISRPRVDRVRRDLGRAVGSRRSGLNWFEVVPGKLANPLHCHSMEEEIFVILDGSGTLLLGEEETPVGPGHVIARPAGTRVGHALRAETALTFLAYGTREPGDVAFYPRSGKVAFRGVGLMARVQAVDYWDGED